MTDFRPQGDKPVANALSPSRRRVLAGIGGLAVGWFEIPAFAQQNGVMILHAQETGALPDGTAAPTRPPSIERWTYEGVAPGPLLRIKRGDELNVRLVNELREPTTIHWHGVRGPNAMDGVPHLTQAPVPPGGSFDYRLRPPDAGTFWYHPAGNAAGQIGRGLRGALIVDEAGPVPVDRDVLAVFEDWPAVADDGSGEQPSAAVTVNGGGAFDIAVRSGERIRLRLVNASMTRVLVLRFDGHAPTVMAIDGQPAEPFVARDARLMLAPGNRGDLFIDMAAAPGTRTPVLLLNGRSEVPIAHLFYDPAAIRPAPLPDPAPLPAGALPARLDFRNAQRQTVALDTLPPAASAVHERPAAFSAQRGRVVVLALANRTPSPQTVHIHGHHVRLLDRLDDGWKPFWLDTVTVDAGKTDRVAFLADNPGRWLIDCQALSAPYPRTSAWFSVTA